MISHTVIRMGPYTFQEIGEGQAFVYCPQSDIRVTRLIIPRLGHLFEVEELIVGRNSQLLEPMPGHVFREGSDLSLLPGDVCVRGTQIALKVRYSSELSMEIAPILKKLDLCFNCGGPDKIGHPDASCFYCGVKKKEEVNLKQIFKAAYFEAFLTGVMLRE